MYKRLQFNLCILLLRRHNIFAKTNLFSILPCTIKFLTAKSLPRHPLAQATNKRESHLNEEFLFFISVSLCLGVSDLCGKIPRPPNKILKPQNKFPPSSFFVPLLLLPPRSAIPQSSLTTLNRAALQIHSKMISTSFGKTLS